MGWDDERGVSEVLGAILLFGIIVLAIGGYQSFVVPQQNAEVEMKHDAQINGEFPDIQEAVSNAVATQRHRTASLTLGGEYPSRVFAVDPPGISGSVSTAAQGPITMSVDGSEKNLIDHEEFCGAEAYSESRAIQYTARYSELDSNGQFVYENGVTYRIAGTNIIQKTDQELIDGNTIRVNALTTNDFHRTGGSNEQLRFHAGETRYERVHLETGDTLELPTSIKNEEQWEDILSEEIADGKVDGVSVQDGQVIISFVEGTYTVECTPVGIGSTPNQKSDPGPHGPKSPGELNPSDVVRLEGSSLKNQNELHMDFVSVEDEIRLSEARFNFFFNAVGNPPNIDSISALKPENGNDRLAENLEIGGDWQVLEDPIIIETDNDGTTVVAEFNNNAPKQAIMAISFVIEDTNERVQYIIGIDNN